MQSRQRNASVAPTQKLEHRKLRVAGFAVMATAFGGIATIIGAIIQITPQWSAANKGQETPQITAAAATAPEAPSGLPIELALRGDPVTSRAERTPEVAKEVLPPEAPSPLPKKESDVPDVLSNKEKSSSPSECVAMIARVGEGERTGEYDELLEKALPQGRVLDYGRFNDRAATASFFKTLSNDAMPYFAATGFENFAGAVILIDEKSGDSGLGQPSIHSIKVTLQIRVVLVPSGRVVMLRDVESTGADFSPGSALKAARSRAEFSRSELQKAFK